MQENAQKELTASCASFFSSSFTAVNIGLLKMPSSLSHQLQSALQLCHFSDTNFAKLLSRCEIFQVVRFAQKRSCYRFYGTF
jgi:hypothetical protein